MFKNWLYEVLCNFCRFNENKKKNKKYDQHFLKYGNGRSTIQIILFDKRIKIVKLYLLRSAR